MYSLPHHWHAQDASNSSGPGQGWEHGNSFGGMRSSKMGNFAVRDGPVQLNHRLAKVPSVWELWQADAAEAASSIREQR